MYRASLSNAVTDPRKAFGDTIGLMLSNHNPRTVTMNVEAIDKIDQDKALAIYKERFAVPADFTFILVGNIDPENAEVQKAITTYLGGLKSKKGGEKYTDLKIRKPLGKVSNNFSRQMKVNKASNYILYSGKMEFNVQNRTLMTAIGNILSTRYLESIREKEGGSYGVGVRGGLSNTPISEASLMMQFDTDPAKQEKLMGIIHSEVAEIVKNGPRADDLQKVKENMLKKYTEDTETNSWWQVSVNRHYQDKIDLLKDYKASVEALSPELIQKTLKALVNQGNVIQVVMSPEVK
jgi:zinc protease